MGTAAFGSASPISSRVAWAETWDPRADRGQRKVYLDPNCITIERCLLGMKMRIAVPVQSYVGVLLAVDEMDSNRVYLISLQHPDPDLSVILAQTSEQTDVMGTWRHWASVFAKPALIDSRFTFGEKPDRGIPARPLIGRFNSSLGMRRPRFLARRKIGRQQRLDNVFQGEREIICYE
jgi:hypothetical protein